jgi:hypothetical protein
MQKLRKNRGKLNEKIGGFDKITYSVAINED